MVEPLPDFSKLGVNELDGYEKLPEKTIGTVNKTTSAINALVQAKIAEISQEKTADQTVQKARALHNRVQEMNQKIFGSLPIGLKILHVIGLFLNVLGFPLRSPIEFINTENIFNTVQKAQKQEKETNKKFDTLFTASFSSKEEAEDAIQAYNGEKEMYATWKNKDGMGVVTKDPKTGSVESISYSSQIEKGPFIEKYAKSLKLQKSDAEKNRTSCEENFFKAVKQNLIVAQDTEQQKIIEGIAASKNSGYILLAKKSDPKATDNAFSLVTFTDSGDYTQHTVSFTRYGRVRIDPKYNGQETFRSVEKLLEHFKKQNVTPLRAEKVQEYDTAIALYKIILGQLMQASALDTLSDSLKTLNTKIEKSYEQYKIFAIDKPLLLDSLCVIQKFQEAFMTKNNKKCHEILQEVKQNKNLKFPQQRYIIQSFLAILSKITKPTSTDHISLQKECQQVLQENYGMGIQNAGNSCYVNAVVQALRNVPSFREDFEPQKGKEENVMAEMLFDLFGIVEGGQKRRITEREIHTFRNVARELGFRGDEYSQEDAMEFCDFLLNQVNIKPTRFLFKFQEDPHFTKKINRPKDILVKNLPLEIAVDKEKTSIQDLIVSAPTAEEGNPKCTILLPSEEEAPKMLPITLKRFKYTVSGAQKISTPIQPSEEITIPIQGSNKKAYYKLQTMVIHDGKSSHSGHYYSYVPRTIQGKETLLEFNDSTVSAHHDQAKDAAYTNAFQNGYIFFYELEKVA